MHPEYDELYDLNKDPGESKNIIGSYIGKIKSNDLKSELAQLVRESISL